MNLNVIALNVLGLTVSEAPCLTVPKALGEKAIRLVRRLGFFNRELRVQQVGDSLRIPLISKPLPADTKDFKKSLPEFEISSYNFPGRAKRPLKLVDLIEDKLPSHLLAGLPHAIDFVGHIAVIEIPPELEDYKKTVGEAILKSHRRVRTVLAKSSAVKGVYRLREFEVIAGVEETETAHREYGCVFHVDLAKVYFSPRLSHEHSRVASQVRDGETIIDMFAGVGPFSILIAKRCEDAQVYALDINPDAVGYLMKNIILNHVDENVTPVLGEARQVIEERFVGAADRVIMNLPEKSIEYVDAACRALKPKGGILHFYEFAGAPDPLETAKVRLIEAVKQTTRNVERVLLARIVRGTSPFIWQVVVDAKVR